MQNPPPPDNLTKVLATYGALLASIGFGWNLYRDLRDRAMLKVSASISRLAVDGQGNWFAITSAVKMAGTNQRFIVMSVVNVRAAFDCVEGLGWQVSEADERHAICRSRQNNQQSLAEEAPRGRRAQRVH